MTGQKVNLVLSWD